MTPLYTRTPRSAPTATGLSRRSTAALALLCAPLAAGVLWPTVAGAAPARTDQAHQVGTTATTSPTAGYSGHSDGTDLYATAADLSSTLGVTTAEISQSAAGIDSTGLSATADATDAFGLPLSDAISAGETAYGHGLGAGVGLLDGKTAAPSVALSDENATSPTAHSTSGSGVLALPAALSTLATANVMPSAAQAETTSADNACITGSPVSLGTSHVVNATAVTAGGVSVAAVAGSVKNYSFTQLVRPITAAGTVITSPDAGLVSETIETLAPVTVLQGTPAAVTITLLAPIELATEAGGQTGTSVVSYAPVGRGPNDPLATISADGKTATLTSQELLGGDGIDLDLGVADVIIGGAAHALGGASGSTPATTVNGTATSAAADLIRITAPGTPLTAASKTAPAGNGPIGALLNPVLAPVVTAVSPVLDSLQKTLANTGVDVADVAVGHLESTATVPSDGVVCTSVVTSPTSSATPAPSGTATPTPASSDGTGTGQSNPLGESRLDVSAAQVPAGQTFTYTVRIPNRGVLPIEDLTVVDTPNGGPPPQEFVASVPPATSVTDDVHTYNLGTLPPNQLDTVVLTYRVPADAPAGTVYGDAAVITGEYDGTTLTMPVSVSGPTVGTVEDESCDLVESTYASNLQVVTGEQFGYFVNVLNAGASPCSATTISDTLNVGVTFVGCSANCTRSGQTLLWRLNTLAPGQSEVVDARADVDLTVGRIPDTATASAAGGSSATATTEDPDVSGVSVASAGLPVGTHVLGEMLAFTGMTPLIPLSALALVAAGAAAFVLRRRLGRL